MPTAASTCTLGQVELLERRTQLAELEAALADADAGHGSVVLVTGEAGIGKTALVRTFASALGSSHVVLWGMCDELLTPRPFGPFRDMAPQLGVELDEASGAAMLDALLVALSGRRRRMVVVIEDAHRADEATLDAIRFLGRRIRQLPALLVVTYRDDELPAEHLLRFAVGAIPPDDLRRIALPRLSRCGVAQLAGREDVAELYRHTRGNPFFVTEMLAAPSAAVPRSVQDAVMARVRRLDHRARACVEIVAVIPNRSERWLLEVCGVADGIAGATHRGIVHVDGPYVCFTHELARRAVEHSLSPERRQELHPQVLAALAAQGADPARLVHHAAHAGDSGAVVRYGPAAARQAAALASRREAIAHFQHALRYSELFSAEDLADLQFHYAYECYLTGRHEDAKRAVSEAIKLSEESGGHERFGASLTLLAEIHWFMGSGEQAEGTSRRACEVLELQPPSSAQAWAYAQRARLAMVDRRLNEAIEWGEKAVDLARDQDDVGVLVHVLNTVGTAQALFPPYDNKLLLESSELALRNGMKVATSRAYVNLVIGYLDHLEYVQAGTFLHDGLEFCAQYDLISAWNRLMALRSEWHLEQGRWSEAEYDANRLLSVEDVSRLEALTVLARLQARRGSDAAAQLIDQAGRFADRIGDAQHLLPVGVSQLEAAWLGGSLPEATPIVSKMVKLAHRCGSARWIGESALWAHRVGVLDTPPADALEPFALQIAGQSAEAAAAWEALGRPYAQADALADASEPDLLLEALAILDRLGARPRAAMVRRRLSQLGVSSIPRGPRESTRGNVAGLTPRQIEVLKLFAEDLTYQEIACRLHVSTKTVDHHATAIRMKLGVTTSAAAVAEARKRGILGREHDAVPKRHASID